jgi:hypothetical protein
VLLGTLFGYNFKQMMKSLMIVPHHR